MYQPYQIANATPPAAPNMPPTRGSRLDALGLGAPPSAPVGLPTDQGFLNTPQFAALPPEQQAAIRKVASGQATSAVAAPASPSPSFPLGTVPTSSVVPNAAGMSPQQDARVAANKEFQVQDAKNRAEMYGKMQTTALSNQPKIAKFERIGQLLGDYSGGKLADQGFELARLGTSLGINIDPKLPNKEAANTLSNEVALELRSTAEGSGMPGAMSDADRNYLKSMTPQLAQTAEGRKLIIESRVSVWKREQQIAEMARKYRQKHGSIDEDFFSQLQGWSNRNPIFNANR